MVPENKVIVVTGAANGIGAALARRFADLGARALILCDMDVKGTQELAAGLSLPAQDLLTLRCDVSRKSEIDALVSNAIDAFGQIDLFCSNAGVIVTGDEASPIGDWQKAWDINVMAHVHAANAVLPGMLARGNGYLLNTISAAGMLTSVGAAPYAVSKHAALAFAEWLSITYGGSGIGVSALCPQAVRTKMIEDAIASGAGSAVASGGDILSAEAVAEQTTDGMEEGRFLILSHPETQRFAEAKVADIDRWLSGMRRYAASL